MASSLNKNIKLHLSLKSMNLWSCNFAIQLFVMSTVLVFGISNDLFAGSRTPDDPEPSVKITADAENDALMYLPVVNLKKVNPLLDIIENIDTERVVLVGETHTRYDHHLVQLEVLKLLYKKSNKLAIGVEWFQRPFQEHLDAYIAGRISEHEMLDKTEYFARWRYDYRNYRPILQYARAQKIPVIALNAPLELNQALTESGVDDLPDELKPWLPKDYDWSDKVYEQRLRDVFDQHPGYPGKFEEFLRGQLTWDESMAETAADYLVANPEARMLILAGSGHIMYDSGIPNRIKRRIDVEQVSILVSEELLPASKSIADFLVLSDAQELEPAGLIGAMLETTGKLVTVKGFSDDSAIKDAGVNEGAIIIRVDAEPVESFAEFKLMLMGKKQGDTVNIDYLESAEDSKNSIKSVTINLR